MESLRLRSPRGDLVLILHSAWVISGSNGEVVLKRAGTQVSKKKHGTFLVYFTASTHVVVDRETTVVAENVATLVPVEKFVLDFPSQDSLYKWRDSQVELAVATSVGRDRADRIVVHIANLSRVRRVEVKERDWRKIKW